MARRRRKKNIRRIPGVGAVAKPKRRAPHPTRIPGVGPIVRSSYTK